MTDEDAEEIEEKKEELKETETEELPLPNATIVRLMKNNLSEGKMIKKEVKIAMNKFLEEVLKDVTKRLDDYPYATIDYHMFREAIKPFKQGKEIGKEKDRLAQHLETIISDCRSIQRDIDRKFEEPKTSGRDIEL